MRSTVAVLVMLFAGGAGRPALAQPTREVTYNPRSVIRIDARLRMTTLLVLPDTEEILDFVCGDKDYWVISGAQNLAYIKPAKAGAATNLNLVTASGHVYSFLLVEGSPDPDLKVYVVPDPNAPPTTPTIRRAAAADLDAVRKEAAAAAERNAQVVIDRFKAGYPTQLRFPYVFKARTKPFHVTAIYHDDRFTYIRTEGRELPAVYEVVDHVPNLVGYQVDHGLYIVSKVLDHGYLAIGRQILPFDAAGR